MKGIFFIMPDETYVYSDTNFVLSKAYIPPATPKTVYVDIPGADGSIDLSEAFGRVMFKDRECEFTFSVLPHLDFEEVKTEISNKLNGKNVMIYLEKDPNYYWIGRCFVNDYKSDEGKNQIVITATVSPYKLNVEPFEQKYGTSTNSPKTIIVDTASPVTLTLKFTKQATVTILGETTNYQAGTYKIYNVPNGEYQFVLTCSGETTISYQGRSL